MSVCDTVTLHKPLQEFTKPARGVLQEMQQNLGITTRQAVCIFGHYRDPAPFRSVFLNRRAAARYRALTSFKPGRERFSWNLSFYFSNNFS